MPRDTVDRAIKRGAGDTDADNLMELVYEGYGPSGVAILVEAMTDNKNRTVAEVRHAFSKAGGSLGTSGSVAYLFNQQGQLYFAPGTDEEKLMEAALEAGAEDIHSHPDGTLEVITSANSFGEVKDQLAAAGFTSVSAEVTKVADNYIDLDQETSNKVLKLMDMLEDLDDTQNVYCNANFADDLSS
jgi:YebC/PmpR family DNA-binding regulatory protein